MAADDEFEMETCRACRGTGKVISNLGGTANEVDCPWCEGAGKFIPEHDAQAKWLAAQGGDSAGEGGDKASEAAAGAPSDPVDG